MGQPYLGEIRMFGGNFAPVGWMFCEGQVLPIIEYDILFNLIGTTYGGDGQSTFALPDLRGRVPIHQGSAYTIGQQGGTESVTLTTNQMPNHTHALLASNTQGGLSSPGGHHLANSPVYSDGSGTPVAMAASAVATSGGSQPHSNLQPYLCVSFIISLLGIYPTPS